MDKIKTGIVGLGSMADALAGAVMASEDMQLAALCTRSPEKLAARAAAWGVEATYTAYDDMLKNAGLDAIVVATPNHLHTPMTLAALKAGKAVFCEKPPALTAADAKEMMDRAESSGKLLMYGLVFRFAEKYALVRELRDKGTFGDIYYGKAGIVRRAGDPGGWFSQKALSGGGPLIDLGPHIIDLAMLTMGDFEPVSVFARTFKRAENLGHVRYHGGYRAAEADGKTGDVEELASLVINASSGACLLVETSYASHIPDDAMYMSMLGTRGGVEVDPILRISTTLHDVLVDVTPRIDCADFDYAGGIVREMQHFADCLMGRAECIAPPLAGYTLMRVIEGAYRSAESGKLVEI